MIDFPKRILMLGYGAVAQCTLPILLKHFRVPPEYITILDFEDRAEGLKPWTSRGLRFVRQRITPENLGAMLGQYVSAGDMLLDLAWNIDCCEIVEWCHDRGVLYLNTSVEIWDPYTGATKKHPTERTLYWRHMNLRRVTSGWRALGPTAVLEHGANPGLISHWTKQGLLDLAEKLLEDKKVNNGDADEIRQLVNDQTFNRLAMKLGVKVIHCSERDTQVTSQPKQVDEFVNTWSIEGFREEGITTAEMGWGTHEKQLPPLTYRHSDGPGNQICLARMGMNTWVVSWVPYFSIRGMIIRHGEAFTISDRLTVWEDGRAIYRPTVHYAYCPCDGAIVSLEELRGRDYDLQSKLRIMRDEITGGADILGAVDGPRLQLLVDGQRVVDRGIAAAGAPSERHHDAGGHRRGGGGNVDGGESAAQRVLARRSAARVRVENRPALSGPIALAAVRLDAAEVLREQLPRLQSARSRFGRPVAVQKLLDYRRGLEWSRDENSRN